MIRTEEISERLVSMVDELSHPGVLQNVAAFAAGPAAEKPPQRDLACYVIMGGLEGHAADAVTGMFRQGFRETLSLVVVRRVLGDQHGAKALDAISPVIRAIVLALCGWSPGGIAGALELVSAGIIGFKHGAIHAQIDIAFNDQLRIAA